jgi:hypothetical protein
MNKIFGAAVGLLVLVATPALADTPCLELSLIWNYKALNDKTLIVEDESHRKFKLTLMGYCPELPYKQRLGFDVPGGTGLTCISPGDEVISRDLGFPWRCPIVNVVPYTPAMEKADLAAAKAQQQSR